MKQFIITDPCYIFDEKQYQDICQLYDKFREMGLNENALDPFEAQKFPLESKHCETKQPIVFHIIKGTPNGDGGYDFRGQEIGVDAGMLCIAESKKGWDKEQLGATFETLSEAESHFRHILSKF
jgi:hypothetical protein